MSQQYTQKTIDQLLNESLNRQTNEDSSQMASDLLSLLEKDRLHQQSQMRESASPELATLETRILRSENPIKVTEAEEINILGYAGEWINKSEAVAWRGDIPITKYEINKDSNPEIIMKRNTAVLEYVQELAIRYLRPSTPATPGDIVIIQEANKATKPAPPIIIRQQPARAVTPEPLVFREAPPQPPKQIGTKVVTISGFNLYYK